MNISWTFEFEGTVNGTRPIVLYDARDNQQTLICSFSLTDTTNTSLHNIRVLGILDNGYDFTLLWNTTITTSQKGVPITFTQDPRPRALWGWIKQTSNIYHISSSTGQIINILDIGKLHPSFQGSVLTSEVTITGNADAPLMLLAVQNTQSFQNFFVIAIDLTTNLLLWKYEIGTGMNDTVFGQLIVLFDQEQRPFVVFSTAAHGILALTSQQIK